MFPGKLSELDWDNSQQTPCISQHPHNPHHRCGAGPSTRASSVLQGASFHDIMRMAIGYRLTCIDDPFLRWSYHEPTPSPLLQTGPGEHKQVRRVIGGGWAAWTRGSQNASRHTVWRAAQRLLLAACLEQGGPSQIPSGIGSS